MLTLAVVMIVDPSLMNEMRNSLLIFGAALIILVHRAILPCMGIHLVTELTGLKSAGKRSVRRKKRAV